MPGAAAAAAATSAPADKDKSKEMEHDKAMMALSKPGDELMAPPSHGTCHHRKRVEG
jgi:hypothetical protein